MTESQPGRPVTDRRSSRKQVLSELARAVSEIRQEAKDKGLDKMPAREIRAAVSSARRARRKTIKQPAK